MKWHKEELINGTQYYGRKKKCKAEVTLSSQRNLYYFIIESSDGRLLYNSQSDDSYFLRRDEAQLNAEKWIDENVTVLLNLQ